MLWRLGCSPTASAVQTQIPSDLSTLINLTLTVITSTYGHLDVPSTDTRPDKWALLVMTIMVLISLLRRLGSSLSCLYNEKVAVMGCG